MNETSRKDPTTATIIWVVVHGVLWLILMMIAYFVIPRFKKIFMDFGVELPGPTLLVLIASDWIVEFFYLFLPFVLAADGAVTFMLYQQGDSPGLRRAWLVFMIALPVCVGVFSIIALFSSIAKLTTELSG